MRDELQTLLARLRFDGMAAALDGELERAEREGTPAPELIRRLLCAEAVSQRQRSLAYRLKQARLPWDWTLETFPFDEQPRLNKGQIKTLAGLDFLSRANNIVTLAYGALCRGLLSGRMTAQTQFSGDDLRKSDPKFQGRVSCNTSRRWKDSTISLRKTMASASSILHCGGLSTGRIQRSRFGARGKRVS